MATPTVRLMSAKSYSELCSMADFTPFPSRRKLPGVLRTSTKLIIEDNGMGDISAARPHSLGQDFPNRTIHIVSHPETLGPDLRLAVLSSSTTIVEQIQSYRAFSAGWTNRVLQGATAWLLRNPESWKTVANTRNHLSTAPRRSRPRAEITGRGDTSRQRFPASMALSTACRSKPSTR